MESMEVKMTKIVYNACYGGFSISDEAVERYAEIKGITLYSDNDKWGNHYYLCPVEEFNEIYKEEDNAPVGPGRYARSNALCFSRRDISRADPVLAQVVEELGDRANGSYAKLEIEEVPTGTLYRIDEYDGRETVMTMDGYDWNVA